MSMHGSRLPICLAWTLGVICGCASVPPVPKSASSRPPDRASRNQSEDEDGGWLFDRLVGRESSAARQKRSSAVVAASATEPVIAPPEPVAAVEAEPLGEDEDSGFDLSNLAPDNIYKRLKELAGFGPDEQLARTLMQEGESLFAERQYEDAAAKFKSAAFRWPDSVLEEDALFLQGESYFFSDQYPKAQDTYDNLLKKYDNSRHLDTAVKRLFALGRYWEQLHDANPQWPVTPNLLDKKRPLFDTFGNALKAYESVRLKDPTGPLADDSLMATANAYFRKGRFEDAAFHYDILRKEYPKSEHQMQAHVLGLQAKIQVYQGPWYDGTPLKEADEIAEQALIQFGSQLGDERPRILAMRERIAEEKAERDWVIAQFYDRKKAYGSARIYYQRIVKDYPASQAALRAHVRLEQIRSQPDSPPNRFQRLADAFAAEQ